MDQYSGSTYLYKLSNPLPVRQFYLTILNKYFASTLNLDAIEIGPGNILTNLEFSKLFKSYTTVESDNDLYILSKSICEKFGSTINLNKSKIEDFDSNQLYDLAIFINVFHLVDKIQTIKKINQLLRYQSILFVVEPKPVPIGWGDCRLNKRSDKFDSDLWNIKKALLISTKNFLLNAQHFGFEVTYHDLLKKDVYVLKTI